MRKIFKHHRGGLYVVLHDAVESTNARVGKSVVVYASMTTGQIHTRDADEFYGTVEQPIDQTHSRTAPRFRHVCGQVGSQTSIVGAIPIVCQKLHGHKGECFGVWP